MDIAGGMAQMQAMAVAAVIAGGGDMTLTRNAQVAADPATPWKTQTQVNEAPAKVILQPLDIAFFKEGADLSGQGGALIAFETAPDFTPASGDMLTDANGVKYSILQSTPVVPLNAQLWRLVIRA
jgi:hypothetical protein